MKDKIILLIVLLVAIVLIHTGSRPVLDTSKMTEQEKSMVQFGEAAGL